VIGDLIWVSTDLSMSDGLCLALESSSVRASVALGRAGKVVFSAETEAGRRPSEVLLEPLEQALSLLSGESIDLVVVGTGPGSYNGARVGIAAGQGVALVHGCPTIGLCSLEALAKVRAGGKCLALGDARRGSYFSIELCGGVLLGNPDIVGHEPFIQKVSSASRLGVSLLTLEDPGRLKLPTEIEIEWGAPCAARLLEAWSAKSERERELLLGIPPEPFYLRPPHITQAR
jgi:tRNA threonylcarbamoyladenosine biosynthesis protein TsaB